MAKVLLDTSIIIDFLRRKDKEKSPFFKLADDDNQLFASIITHTELHAGKSIWENQLAKKELSILFSGIKLIELDEEISQTAGEIKATSGLDLIDAVIAATAIKHSLNLATLNTKDFDKIEEAKLLKV